MANWKEGDRVRIVTRPVTEEDRKKGVYFDHMAGLVGTVQNVYANDEIAVKIDPDTLSPVSSRVHNDATKRMRERFLGSVSEEQKKQLTPEELDFDTNYNHLVSGKDIEKIK
jgi:hypothetical protein